MKWPSIAVRVEPETVMNKMNVTLRQLRAFVEVAEAKHFTRAADKMDLSQSTVSTLVRELEVNLDLRLFDRHTRMLSLTQAGAEILPLARKALADLDSVLGSSSELKTLGRGRVSIAASSLQAALMLPRVIRDFGVAHPGVTVDLHDVPQPDVLEMVRSGAVDFGIGTESGVRHDLGARVLMTDTFVIMMPPDHALSRKRELQWTDLEGYPMIGSPPGNPLREQVDVALARHGIELTRRYEISLPLTIIGMVEGGLGIAVLTTTASRLALSLGLVVKPVTNPLIKRDVSLLFHAERSLSPAAKNFSDLLFKRRSQLLKV